MKIDNKKARIILAVIIAVSLVISTVYMFSKQGFHEDELLTYNLANSSKQLNVDGGWNSPEDFNEYLAVSPDEVGGQAVLGRQQCRATPWLTERHGYDPTSSSAASGCSPGFQPWRYG